MTNDELRRVYGDYREALFYWYSVKGLFPLSKDEQAAAWLFVSDMAYSVARAHYGKPQSFRSAATPRTQNYYDVPTSQLGVKYYHFHTDRCADLIETLRKYTNVTAYCAILLIFGDVSTVKNFSGLHFYLLKTLNKQMKSVWWCLFNYRKFFPSREVIRHYALKGVAVPPASALVINRIEGLRRKYGHILLPEEEGVLCKSMRQGLLYEISKPLLNQVSLDVLEMSDDGFANVTNVFGD